MVKPTSSSTPLLNSTSLLVKSDDQAGPVDIDMSDSSTSLVPSKLTQAMADYWGEHRKAVLKALFAATIAGSSLGLYIKLTEDSSNFVRASSLTVNSFVNYLSALDTWAYIEGVMDSRNGSARNRCVEGVFAVMCAAIVGLGAMFISLGSAGPDDSMLEKVFLR